MNSSNLLSDNQRYQEQVTSNKEKRDWNISNFFRALFGNTGKGKKMATNRVTGQRGTDPSYSNRGYGHNSDNISGGLINTHQNQPSTREDSQADHYGRQNSEYSPATDNSADQTDFTEQTLYLVKEFKRRIQSIKQQDQVINKQKLIEKIVSDIRREKYPQLNYDEWTRNLPENINKCSKRILIESMAYGNDPKQMENILRAKMEEPDSNENPGETSLGEIIEPLRKLTRNFNSSFNLFRAVLNIDDNKIDRADRMFYSEACRLVDNLQDYKIDHAHDQVQAIRLMHYETNDEEQLQRFIIQCRNFDDAYSYLQQLARERATKNSRSSASATTRSSGDNRVDKSIIKKPDNYNQQPNYYPSSPSSNIDQTNRSSNSSSNRSTRNDASRTGTGDGRGYYGDNSTYSQFK